MSSRRTARVASVIREVVSTAILTELRDPRIRNVTVLGAEVSPDLRYARVRISVMGDEKMASLTMHGLQSARGYLQSKVADRIRSRYTPELRFVLDSGIRRSAETSRILQDVIEDDLAVETDDTETTDEQADDAMLTDSAFDESDSSSAAGAAVERRPDNHPDKPGSEAVTDVE